jgi:hypothetical protein
MEGDLRDVNLLETDGRAANAGNETPFAKRAA